MSAKDRARESNRQRLIIGNNYGQDPSSAKRISRLEIDAQTFGAGDNPSFGEIVLAPGVAPGPTPPPTPPAPPSAYRGFVIAARADAAGSSYTNPQAWAVTSLDKGLTWTPYFLVQSGNGITLWSIASGPGGSANQSVVLVAVRTSTQGKSYVISQDSGVSWTNVASTGTTQPGVVFTANDGNGTWVMGGQNSSLDNLSSFVGNTLSAGAFASPNPGTYNFIGANEDGEWRVARTGLTEIFTSTDGVNFAQDSTITLPNAVRHGTYAGGNRFIIVGENGSVAYADGYDQPWTDLGAGVSINRLNGIASNKNGVVIAVGDNGQIMRSVDNGTTWLSLGTPGVGNFMSVASDEEAVFAAVTSSGDVYRSTNFGATWSSAGNAFTGITSNSVTTVRWGMCAVL